MPDCIPIIASNCVSLAVGFGVGYMAHRLSLKREREARNHAATIAKDTRKRTFVAFLKEWRSELSAFLPPVNPFGHGVFREYQSKLHKFHGQSALLAKDFTASETFERLANRLSGLNQQDMTSQNKPEKDIILESIDALIDFVEHN